MKKILAFMLTLTFLLAISACSSGTESNNNAEENKIVPETELVITATNYQFDQNEYHLKKDVPVKITFKNDEGNHGILIPGLKVQLDGKNDSKVIVPTKSGEYEMSCAIMCGTGHGTMTAKIIVD
ncbi:cupredoxin domain-containing protein [Paenibacillus segetis]|uniref:EfeO-type cupredoxin-like domain-containing protein n=1 Tax=Paenibacillus segetis TaxID=1325360 RepID=A0ABQ1Y6C8_9BACL|nr:cupredoxin domain-containing protein [Paenibacillus segetis]GGH13904.1 hypothetical protein GCM10008013_07230 [Paenibacillus segetis]